MPNEQASIERQLAEVHRSGQERLGLTVALVAFFAWIESKADSPNQPGIADEAIEETLDIAQQARKISHKLAARYYNLARAIGSGEALPDIGGQFTTGRATLEQIYGAMAESLNEVNELADLDFPQGGPDAGETDSGKSMEQRLDDLEKTIIEAFQDLIPDDVSEEVEVTALEEDWDWPEFDEQEAEDDLLAELEELEREQLAQIKKIRKAEKAFKKQQEQLAKLDQTTAAKAAGRSDLSVLDPGRRLIHEVGSADGKRLAWMRVTGPTPCAFCAMLASRGAVYKSERSALFDGYGKLYHPNCHCTVIPVFTDNPVYSKRDKYFIDNWTPVTKGYSGRAALRQWRRWLRAQYRAGQVPDTTYGPARPA